MDAHEVVEANNGAEAINLFSQSDFDLVMTDYRMPFVDGSELAAKIRQIAPSKPILMVTGHGYRPSPRNPVNAVLRKPFALAELRSAVNGLLSPVENAG